ncbi:MAG: type II toxin-antitoxin system HicA family toxin [Candidatus Binatia bacterium]
MGKYESVLLRIVRGGADANIPFEDLRGLLRRLGFEERVRGDHYIFSKQGVAEILNIQPRGRQAKPYQVKQVRGVIVKYHLEDDADAK